MLNKNFSVQQLYEITEFIIKFHLLVYIKILRYDITADSEFVYLRQYVVFCSIGLLYLKDTVVAVALGNLQALQRSLQALNVPNNQGPIYS